MWTSLGPLFCRPHIAGQATEPGGGHTGPLEGGTAQTSGNWVRNLHHPSGVPRGHRKPGFETWSLVNTEDVWFKTTNTERNRAKVPMGGTQGVRARASLAVPDPLPSGPLCFCRSHRPESPSCPYTHLLVPSPRSPVNPQQLLSPLPRMTSFPSHLHAPPSEAHTPTFPPCSHTALLYSWNAPPQLSMGADTCTWPSPSRAYHVTLGCVSFVIHPPFSSTERSGRKVIKSTDSEAI